LASVWDAFSLSGPPKRKTRFSNGGDFLNIFVNNGEANSTALVVIKQDGVKGQLGSPELICKGHGPPYLLLCCFFASSLRVTLNVQINLDERLLR